MKNAPFQFRSSQVSMDRLRRALRRVGISEVTVTEDGLLVRSEWVGEPLSIDWKSTWVADGAELEDAGVEVRHEGRVIEEIDVSALLRTRLSRPLATVMIERIAEACGRVTGKRA